MNVNKQVTYLIQIVRKLGMRLSLLVSLMLSLLYSGGNYPNLPLYRKLCVPPGSVWTYRSRQCKCYVTLLRVWLLFVCPWLLYQPVTTISFESVWPKTITSQYYSIKYCCNGNSTTCLLRISDLHMSTTTMSTHCIVDSHNCSRRECFSGDLSSQQK
jgi:hypothetical protein